MTQTQQKSTSPNDARAPRRAALGSAILMLALVGIAWWSAPSGSADAKAAQHRIDPNVATAAELMQLPGIGPKTAAAIIEHRQNCGRTPAFISADDLDAIPRIGPKSIAKLRPFLVFGEAESRAGVLAAAER